MSLWLQANEFSLGLQTILSSLKIVPVLHTQVLQCMGATYVFDFPQWAIAWWLGPYFVLLLGDGRSERM